MKHATIAWTLLAAAAAAGATPVYAQSADDPIKTGFVSVYGGAQPQRRTLTATESLTLYEETATLTSTERIRNGALVQFGGGIRVRRALAVGARFSMFGRPGTGTVVASIPDPVFFNRPRTITADATDLQHKERGIHINATWFMPISERFDLALSGGPSIIHVSQDIISVSVPAGTQNVTVVKAAESGNAVGFNAGVEGLYRFAPQYGVGIFFHYAGGSVDLASAPGTKVGGPQAGVAFQARF